jgi:protein gp37
MSHSKIEWTETTWNPTTGCTKISAGCKNCYAERMSKRLQLMGVSKYEQGFDLAPHPEIVNDPYTWKTPRTVFVNSMSDLFHEHLSIEFIQSVFKTMIDNPRHTFQILTKRAEILLDYSPHLPWSKNIWMGVTVESKEYLDRIECLRMTNAFVKFLSLEPLLNDLGPINLSGIDWVIVGGESGPRARPMNEEWVINIKNCCEDQKVPFFFKQWGGKNKKKAGRILEGKIWNSMPNKTLTIKSINELNK